MTLKLLLLHILLIVAISHTLHLKAKQYSSKETMHRKLFYKTRVKCNGCTSKKNAPTGLFHITIEGWCVIEVTREASDGLEGI